MAGLLAYGTYLPYYRLRRDAIASVLGEGGGPGTRSVACYDEDATSMGVEAARLALNSHPDARPDRIYFSTANPAYLDKTNATVIHAALGLDSHSLAVDMLGSVRSSVGALVAAADAQSTTLAVLADLRTGFPGGSEERDSGDGAAAFLWGSGPPIAELVAQASVTEEFLDRWRLPGASESRTWEERFGEHVYGPLADQAFSDALKKAGITPTDIDHFAVTGLHARAVRTFTARAGVRPEARMADLGSAIGNLGAAAPGIALAAALDRAEADQLIALVVLADGASVLLFRTTDALANRRPARSLVQQVGEGSDTLSYATFLTWRGYLDREPPRRPEPPGPAAPPARRVGAYKFAFVASRCFAPTGAGGDPCGMLHLPPVRVCVRCQSLDQMVAVRMADERGTVSTLTVDRLAYSPSPPVVFVVVDFDGGARFACELTDSEPAGLSIGDRVEMTFRRFLTGNGIHNYFWKARPLRGA